MKDTNNEQKHPYVSMIVPVYNAEAYLDKSVKSMLSQTYGNMEIILVDDGSTDNSAKICEDFAKENNNVVVLHQKNQGPSAARNNGVLAAKGEYITFVDSDDYISRYYVEYLVNLALKTGAEVSIGGYKYIYPSQDTLTDEEKDETEIQEYSPEEALIRMNYGKPFGIFAWGKLYKKELVVKHPYPVGEIYEDLANTYKILGDAGKIVFGNKIIYFWIHRKGSITRSGFDEKQMYALVAVKEQLDYVSKKYPNAVHSARIRYTRKVIELIGIAFQSNSGKMVFNRIKKEMLFLDEFRRDPQVKRTLKIRGMAVKMGYLPAKIVFAMHSGAKESFFNR